MAIAWHDEEVYHGSFLNVWARTVSQPLGGTTRFEVVTRPDAVAIVALRRAGGTDAAGEPSVALVRQLRPAVGAELWEIPAGLIREDERGDTLRTAQRELAEETGAQGGRWQELVHEYTSPGFSTEQITLYLAEDVEIPAGAGPQDASEIPEVRWLPLSQALALGRDGTIQDGKTLLGLTLAAAAAAASQRAEGGAAMPLDPTNAPFARAARYRDPIDPVDIIDVSRQEDTGSGTQNLDTSLKLEDMLLEEFNYASVTAYQAMEDRARLFNNYLVITAGGAAGVVGAIYQLNQAGIKNLEGPVAATLFLLLGILGVAFFFSLLNLRQAYGNSLLAMSMIKEFYLAQFERAMPQARHAFLWRLATLPRGERFGSVTFVKTFTVGLLASLSFGSFAALAGAGLLANALSGDQLIRTSVAIGAVVAVLAALLHFVVYGRMTTYKRSIERVQLNLADLRSKLEASSQPS